MTKTMSRRTAIKGAAAVPVATLPAFTASAFTDPSILLWNAYEAQEQIEMKASETLDLALWGLPTRKYECRYGKVSTHEELAKCQEAWRKFNEARSIEKDLDAEFAEYHKGLDNILAKREAARKAANIDGLRAEYEKERSKGQQLLRDYFASVPTTPEGVAKMVEVYFIFDNGQFEEAKERFLADLPKMLRQLS